MPKCRICQQEVEDEPFHMKTCHPFLKENMLKKLVLPAYWKAVNGLALKMPCTSICGHGRVGAGGIHRFHLTCLQCRLRKYHYGKIDKKHYFKATLRTQFENCESDYIIPYPHGSFYFMFVDPYRRLRSVKDILLVPLVQIVSKLGVSGTRMFQKGKLHLTVIPRADGQLIVPRGANVFIIPIDRDVGRSNARLKTWLIKKLLTIGEQLAQ